MAKYPPHLYTVEVDFGNGLRPFYDHYKNIDEAGIVLRTLTSKMHKTSGLAIQAVRLWKGSNRISDYGMPREVVKWLPPPDPDGVRRIPEKGRRPPCSPGVVAASHFEDIEL